MFEKSLKMLGLNENYTFEDLESAYENAKNKFGDKKIITDARDYLFEDLENKTNLMGKIEESEPGIPSSEMYDVNYVKALQYNMDSDLRADIISFNPKTLEEIIKYYELLNMYDGLKRHSDKNKKEAPKRKRGISIF